jgi:hypothetical protein
MKLWTLNDLPRPPRAAIMRMIATWAASVVLLLGAAAAGAQNKSPSTGDELDVTMQIIVDPDAKLPDEVVRRIPLPARKPADQPTAPDSSTQQTAPDTKAKGQERGREAQEMGREMSESAKERAQNANDQREQARRAVADEKKRNRGPPTDPPNPPGRPPN